MKVTTKTPKASNAAKLIPADLKRCQAEKQESAFTLGGHAGRFISRCERGAVYVAREIKPGSDGQHGQMSLCSMCADILVKTPQGKGAQLYLIMPRCLSTEEAREILAIKNGADIYGYGVAQRLRAMQRRGLAVNQQQGKAPGTERNPHVSIACALFTITDAMSAPKDGAKQQPYFGAIATPHGLKVAREYIKADKIKGVTNK